MRIMLTLAFSFILVGCTKQPDTTVKIAINPWPGYEYLFLAKELGYFEELELNVDLIPFGSLSDAQRAYINNRVDGLASTMIESVQSHILSDRPLKIVLVPDYSNGGDIVIARNTIDSPAQLKGKRVGAEVSSLGIYMLHRTLATAGLTIDDIDLVNVEQSSGKKAFTDDTIDAFVTYPPYSIEILNQPDIHTIFTSAEIPYDIVDTVSISQAVLESHPLLVNKLHQAWEKALDYTQANPDKAYSIMANRQGISAEEFKAVIGDLHILPLQEQIRLFSKPEDLQQKVVDVCEVLNSVESIVFSCDELPNMAYSI